MEIEEIKKKAYEKYPAKLAVVDLKGKEPRQIDLNEEARNAYIEAYKEISALPTIEGWVARNKRPIFMTGKQLFLHSEKPTRFATPFEHEIVREPWCWSSSFCLALPDDMFPDLTWEDEPKKVSVTIKTE